MAITLKKISTESIKEVQRIYEAAPLFCLKVEGVPKIDDSAQKLFEELPPNCTYNDKHVFFVEKNNSPVGVVDLIIGYPEKNIAFIGLLLLDEKFQGQGIGTECYKLIEEFAKQFKVKSIQLGVNDTNTSGKIFWQKLGFEPNGRSRINEGVKVISTVHVMEKNI